MAHELEIVNGQAKMAYVGETPWHSMGNAVTDEAVMYNDEEFIKVAGLDTENEKIPLVTSDDHQEVDYYAVRRMSDKKILGTVGARYTILQNKDAFKWFRPWLETKEAALHTAGSLFGGSRIWVMAKLNRDPMEIVPGDIVEKYLLLSHSHDGSLAVRAGFSGQRVVCWNTLSLAHKSDASKLLRCKHGKNVLQNLENIRETMDLVNSEFEATAEQYRLLANKEVNQADVQKYVKQVFGFGDEKDEDISTRSKNMFEEVFELIEAGKGNDLPGVRGTLWACYNGVTEYLSYNAGRNQENRLNSLWFGQNAKMNEQALEIALTMAS